MLGCVVLDHIWIPLLLPPPPLLRPNCSNVSFQIHHGTEATADLRDSRHQQHRVDNQSFNGFHVASGPKRILKNVSQIEKKNVSLDPARHCICPSPKNTTIHARIHSTVKVIRACLFIV